MTADCNEATQLQNRGAVGLVRRLMVVRKQVLWLVEWRRTKPVATPPRFCN